MEALFYQLLQVAIGNRKTMAAVPSKEQWLELFAIAKKHALVAVAFAGVTKLNTASDYGSSLGIDEKIYLKWLGVVAMTQQRNKEITAACSELCKELAHDGLASCILKGQGNLEYYPEDLKDYRTPGDIDVWCTPIDPRGLDIAVSNGDGKSSHYEKYHGIEAVIEYSLMRARIADVSKPEIRYNNTETHNIWSWDVEIHHRPSMMNSFIHNARIQQWCKDYAQFGAHSYNGFNVPTISFNVVYQLSHIYTHLFDEGIGLRQLLDYYFVLRVLHIEQSSLSDRTESMTPWTKVMGKTVRSNEEIMRIFSRFGMKKFAGATMYVLQNVFAMPNEYLICQPNEKEGRFLLNEIMQAGNFGKYDERIKHGGTKMQHAWEKSKHNFRLLSHYPEEVLWEPFFRLYHWIWRKLELWRY